MRPAAVSSSTLPTAAAWVRSASRSSSSGTSSAAWAGRSPSRPRMAGAISGSARLSRSHARSRTTSGERRASTAMPTCCGEPSRSSVRASAGCSGMRATARSTPPASARVWASPLANRRSSSGSWCSASVPRQSTSAAARRRVRPGWVRSGGRAVMAGSRPSGRCQRRRSRHCRRRKAGWRGSAAKARTGLGARSSVRKAGQGSGRAWPRASASSPPMARSVAAASSRRRGSCRNAATSASWAAAAGPSWPSACSVSRRSQSVRSRNDSSAMPPSPVRQSSVMARSRSWVCRRPMPWVTERAARAAFSPWSVSQRSASVTARRWADVSRCGSALPSPWKLGCTKTGSTACGGRAVGSCRSMARATSANRGSLAASGGRAASGANVACTCFARAAVPGSGSFAAAASAGRCGPAVRRSRPSATMALRRTRGSLSCSRPATAAATSVSPSPSVGRASSRRATVSLSRNCRRPARLRAIGCGSGASWQRPSARMEAVQSSVVPSAATRSSM